MIKASNPPAMPMQLGSDDIFDTSRNLQNSINATSVPSKYQVRTPPPPPPPPPPRLPLSEHRGYWVLVVSLKVEMGRIPVFLMGLVVIWAALAEAEYMIYKDAGKPLNSRIKDLVSRMTLEEKIGQMTQIERGVASAEVIKDYFIGSVLSGGGSVPSKQASAETWINMVNGFQKGALSTRLGIPMIYGIDAVHGHNNVYKATIFPHNVGLGATRDPELVKRIGAATALEVRATGIPYVFRTLYCGLSRSKMGSVLRKLQ
ncbi:hypothetical protein OIU84_027542 [Salix udensis]|uniref:Glycoside hydrolase family 3 N-terminal domain-containing protein n=1 Tax=Salix udensis TaxID=889485 RepID=A0AAD6KH67_9ROSI|nr:hypothetical protein OIU84_027542 [Salix udensis]